METVSAPSATYALIFVNVAVSCYAFFIDRGFINHFAYRVEEVVRKDQQYRIITSSFLHVGFFHLLLNMMTLYFFGPTVEQILGKLGFLVVYFGAIISSGIVTSIVQKKNPNYSSVGASDAVSGVLLSFCVFFPLRDIYFIGIPFGIPAILYGFLYIVISARLMGNPGNAIAHEGHLGGAIAGVALTILMKPEALTRFFG